MANSDVQALDDIRFSSYVSIELSELLFVYLVQLGMDVLSSIDNVLLEGGLVQNINLLLFNLKIV